MAQHQPPLPVAYWSRYSDGPLHPLDAHYLNIERIDSGRLPQPWSGPLSTADTFVLFGNPGSKGTEAPFERDHPEFRTALIGQLSGLASHVFLDKTWEDHPGAEWMRDKFGGDISAGDLADRLCTIDLFPYGAPDNKYGRQIAANLPSSLLICDWVHRELEPRARDGEIALFVMRATRLWGFKPGERSGGLYVAQEHESQGALLTAGSPAGIALRQRLRRGS